MPSAQGIDNTQSSTPLVDPPKPSMVSVFTRLSQNLNEASKFVPQLKDIESTYSQNAVLSASLESTKEELQNLRLSHKNLQKSLSDVRADTQREKDELLLKFANATSENTLHVKGMFAAKEAEMKEKEEALKAELREVKKEAEAQKRRTEAERRGWEGKYMEIRTEDKERLQKEKANGEKYRSERDAERREVRARQLKIDQLQASLEFQAKTITELEQKIQNNERDLGIEELPKNFKTRLEKCAADAHELAKKYFFRDLPSNLLLDHARIHELRKRLQESTFLSSSAFIPLSNSAASKVLRASLATRAISLCLQANIFLSIPAPPSLSHPSQILQDWADCLEELPQRKEAIFRSLGFTALESSNFPEERVDHAVDGVVRAVKPLLAVENKDKDMLGGLEDDLTTFFTGAAGLWRYAQHHSTRIVATMDQDELDDELSMAFEDHNILPPNTSPTLPISPTSQQNSASLLERMPDDKASLPLFPRVLEISTPSTDTASPSEETILHPGYILSPSSMCSVQGHAEYIEYQAQKKRLLAGTSGAHSGARRRARRDSVDIPSSTSTPDRERKEGGDAANCFSARASARDAGIGGASLGKGLGKINGAGVGL